jgi:hypothetical protein
MNHARAITLEWGAGATLRGLLGVALNVVLAVLAGAVLSWAWRATDDLGVEGALGEGRLHETSLGQPPDTTGGRVAP